MQQFPDGAGKVYLCKLALTVVFSELEVRLN